MAAEQIKNPVIYETNVEGQDDEIKDRGILNFSEKKEEEINKPNDELSVPEFAETHVLKSEEEENKPASFTEKLHQSNNNSSSIDEEGEGEKNKSEGLKDKIKEKIGGEKEQEKNAEHDQVIGKGVTCPEEAEDKKGGFVEKIKEKLPAGTHKTDDEHEELVSADITSPEETENKKGFMGNIKEILPGAHRGTNKTNVAPVKYVPIEANKHQKEPEEKKGFTEKIKENLPGNHKTVEKENGNHY